MLTFDWYNNTKVFFGEGKVKKLSELVRNYKSVLLVYGHGSVFKNGAYNDVMQQLKTTNIKITTLDKVTPNPRYESVLQGVKLCKENNVDLILPVGGGSAIDCGKAIALATNYDGNFWETVRKHQTDEIKNAIDIGAVVTLAATGSEMNGYAVISNPETNEKLSLSAKCILPKFAILDPTYTFTLPKYQIACGVVDSFSHCLEQLFSVEKTAIVGDSLLIGMMWTLKTITAKLMQKEINETAYANLMWTATLATNGIPNLGKSSDWATHLIEHAVSGYYDVTHAVGLAVLFPYWMEYILDEDNYDRFYLLGSIFDIQAENNDNPQEICREVIKKVREYFTSLGMPSTLTEIGVKKEDITQLAAAAVMDLKVIGSIRKLSKEDVEQILKSAL